MPGKNTKQAYESYAAPLRDVLACITGHQLICKGGYHASDQPGIFTFAKNPAPLSNSPYCLHLMQQYLFMKRQDHSDWKIKTLKYSYAIERIDDKREIIAFHWENEAKPHYPHIHAHLDLVGKKCHIPTGRVPLEDVVWFAIKELGINPLSSKWEKTILNARGAFMAHKTW